MLQEIYINNFILIDEVRLEFFVGLNVLTGETGAGKSIIIDALNLIMGERIKTDFVRDSGRKAVAEAVFDISTNGDARAFLQENNLLEEDDDTIIVSREILPSGRSTARINNRNVPVGVLKNLSGFLLDMHLQHENQNILKPNMYLNYIDGFNPQIESAVAKVSDLYSQWKEKQQRWQKLVANRNKRMDRIDLLAYQIKEIESAHLQPGEEKELKETRENIQNAHKLMDGAISIINSLYNSDNAQSAYDLVSDALATARGLDDFQTFKSLVGPLEEMYYSLQDMAGTLASFKDSLDFNPGLLDEIENRIYQMKKLYGKYGGSYELIMNYLDNIRRESQQLTDSEEEQEELESIIKSLEARYYQEAGHLSELRKAAGLVLEERVYQELLQLNMPHIKFKVEICSRPTPGANGIDAVDFLFSPNPGEPMRPVAEIASGGEISRFILALKKALAEVFHIPTLIFDEIDVGLGGTALNTVADKLSELAVGHQIILVTHSPQVACHADNHYLIEKKVMDGHTSTTVTKLDRNDQVKELARMLGGEKYSRLTLEHAREMLEKAQKPEN